MYVSMSLCLCVCVSVCLPACLGSTGRRDSNLFFFVVLFVPCCFGVQCISLFVSWPSLFCGCPCCVVYVVDLVVCGCHCCGVCVVLFLCVVSDCGCPCCSVSVVALVRLSIVATRPGKQ